MPLETSQAAIDLGLKIQDKKDEKPVKPEDGDGRSPAAKELLGDG